MAGSSAALTTESGHTSGNDFHMPVFHTDFARGKFREAFRRIKQRVVEVDFPTWNFRQ